MPIIHACLELALNTLKVRGTKIPLRRLHNPPLRPDLTDSSFRNARNRNTIEL